MRNLSIAAVGGLADWDAAGATVVPAGTYAFAASLDFGTVKRIRLTSHLKAEAVNLYDTVDSEDMIDSPEDFDGTTGAPIDASIWGRVTDDDPAGTPAWGPPMRIDSVEIDARAVGQASAGLYVCRCRCAGDPTVTVYSPATGASCKYRQTSSSADHSAQLGTAGTGVVVLQEASGGAPTVVSSCTVHRRRGVVILGLCPGANGHFDVDADNPRTEGMFGRITRGCTS